MVDTGEGEMRRLVEAPAFQWMHCENVLVLSKPKDHADSKQALPGEPTWLKLLSSPNSWLNVSTLYTQILALSLPVHSLLLQTTVMLPLL